MPRRKGQVALNTALDQGWAEFRFLLRNPEFRKDLTRVYNHKKKAVQSTNVQDSQAHDTQLEVHDVYDLIKKWELEWVPAKWPKRKLDEPLSEVVKKEEEFLIHEMKESQADPDPRLRFIFQLPVRAWDPDLEARWEWFQDNLEDNLEALERQKTLVPPAYLKPPNRVLMLRVDLNHPQDVLEEVIKLELKKAKNKRVAGKKSGKTSSGKTRHRLDKATLQLRIFDHVTEGKKFSEIAFVLSKPVSTIKSLYLVASRKIFGSIPKPRLKEIPLVDFDPETHCPQCPTCSIAQTAEDMCQLAKTYANQDYKSQREHLSDNIDLFPERSSFV